MFDGLGWIFGAAIVGTILSVLGIAYFIWNVFFAEHKTIKTKTPPSITWELKARDKTVDTVWIYKFD